MKRHDSKPEQNYERKKLESECSPQSFIKNTNMKINGKRWWGGLFTKFSSYNLSLPWKFTQYSIQLQMYNANKKVKSPFVPSTILCTVIQSFLEVIRHIDLNLKVNARSKIGSLWLNIDFIGFLLTVFLKWLFHIFFHFTFFVERIY